MAENERKTDDLPELERKSVTVVRDERPVPDPEGRLITPRGQDSAERAMLAEMEREKIDSGTQWWLDGEPKRSNRPAPEHEPVREQWWEPER